MYECQTVEEHSYFLLNKITFVNIMSNIANLFTFMTIPAIIHKGIETYGYRMNLKENEKCIVIQLFKKNTCVLFN